MLIRLKTKKTLDGWKIMFTLLQQMNHLNEYFWKEPFITMAFYDTVIANNNFFFS